MVKIGDLWHLFPTRSPTVLDMCARRDLAELTAATAWVKDRWRGLCREVWPEFDDWEERAAIMEFDGGLSRADAEAAAYRRVMGC